MHVRHVDKFAIPFYLTINALDLRPVLEGIGAL